jgi:RNA polymerase sigma factor (sigma-70 family)
VIRSLELDESDRVPLQRFDRVFEQHYAGLKRLATMILGEPSAAEDIVQDTFIKLNQSAVLTSEESDVAAWLRRVCVNASLNQLRADQRLRQRSNRLTDLADTYAPDHERPDAQLLRSEERDRVRSALSAIPETLRACLVLRHSGYSYAEIAATLEIAIGSVGVYLARGERAFRRHFEEKTS